MHEDRSPGSRCARCGVEPATVSPSDAVAAVRSYPRRYRRLLQPVLGRDDADELVRAREPGGWSALEYVAHVRDALHMFDKRMQRVVTEDEPMLGECDLETPPPGAHEQAPEVVLAALHSNADQLARSALDVTGDDWLRAGMFAGYRISALDLLREAVHEGAHHLRDVERALEAARR